MTQIDFDVRSLEMEVNHYLWNYMRILKSVNRLVPS